MEHREINSMEMDHFVTMVHGCENINTHLKTGCGLSYEGEYAFTVLKLHANDAGVYSGQEGFMDTIKQSAKNAKDFIELVIKTIIDAMLIYVGGRSGFNNLVKKFKNSSTAEMFKSAAKKAADNELIPALQKVAAISESIISDEYQEFYRKELEETGPIVTFFIENGKVEQNIKSAIHKLEGSPSESDLSFDSVIGHIDAVIKSGKKILEEAKKDTEANAKLIRNITKCIHKYYRIISGLNAATGRAAKYFKESAKEE